MSDINAVLQENIRIMAQVVTEICQRNTRKNVCEHPLSRNQCYILKILATSGPYLISELARILDISPAAASKNIDRMEHLGLVERQAHLGDRRSFEVKLQEKGRWIASEIDRITTMKMVPVMAQFSEDEKALLLDFLQRVVRHTLADEAHTDLICLQCGGKCGKQCTVEAGRGPCSRPEKT